jgi:anti-sigma factor RsiW
MLAVIATIAALVAPAPPSVEKVAAAALSAPEAAPPSGDSYLPGFRAVGTRTDTVDGRRAETVIYRRGTVGIHYTVVEGKPLDLPDGDRARDGDRTLALASDGDVSLVVWHADGKTCILASRATTPEAMADLLRRA